MDKNVKLSLVMIGLIIGIISIGTTFKVNDEHREKLLLVSKGKIEYAARNCYLDEVCTGETVDLGFLIKKGYIDRQVHPLSKEYIQDNLNVKCKDYVCEVDNL